MIIIKPQDIEDEEIKKEDCPNCRNKMLNHYGNLICIKCKIEIESKDVKK